MKDLGITEYKYKQFIDIILKLRDTLDQSYVDIILNNDDIIYYPGKGYYACIKERVPVEDISQRSYKVTQDFKYNISFYKLEEGLEYHTLSFFDSYGAIYHKFQKTLSPSVYYDIYILILIVIVNYNSN